MNQNWNPIVERCLNCREVEPDFKDNDNGLCAPCQTLRAGIEADYDSDFIAWLLDNYKQPYQDEAQIEELHQQFLNDCFRQGSPSVEDHPGHSGFRLHSLLNPVKF